MPCAQESEKLFLKRFGASGQRREIGTVKAAEQIQFPEAEFLAHDVELLLHLARFTERGTGVSRCAEEGKTLPPGAKLLVPARETAVIRRAPARLVLRTV